MTRPVSVHHQDSGSGVRLLHHVRKMMPVVSCERRPKNHQVEGVPIRVYSAAKTVADCFKFRNKIGLDVAIEALKDCLRQKKANVNEIYRYSQNLPG